MNDETRELIAEIVSTTGGVFVLEPSPACGDCGRAGDRGRMATESCEYCGESADDEFDPDFYGDEEEVIHA